MGRLRATIPLHCASGKRCYVDRQRARQAMRRAQQVHVGKLRIYRCLYAIGARPGCRQYHLASVKERAYA
jgi:hypothetical protein